jgi:hypothetical protein
MSLLEESEGGLREGLLPERASDLSRTSNSSPPGRTIIRLAGESATPIPPSDPEISPTGMER